VVKSFRPHLVLHFTAAVCRFTLIKQRVLVCRVYKSTANSRKTASDITCKLKQENHVIVSRHAVSKRLNDVGLVGRVAVKKPFISKKNQNTRLDFAKQHREWTLENWKRVAFLDESKFSLFGSSGRRYV
jgi:Transposase.